MASFLSTPLIEAENAIAADTAFRTWCGATDAADAKSNFIFSDDIKNEGDLPSRYCGISEMENWQFARIADGAGRGSFRFTSGQFSMVFIQEVGEAITDYTEANRIAFKDFIAGFVSEFINNFEGTGQRLSNVTHIPFSETFPMRGQSTEAGKYFYQYGVVAEVGVF